jgi:hypothetical protein
MVTKLLPSFEEASVVFGGPRSLTIPDPVDFGLSVCPSMSLPDHLEAEVTKMGLKLARVPRLLAATRHGFTFYVTDPSVPLIRRYI